VSRLVFEGSNAVASVLAGWIYRDTNNTDIWPRIVKRGTGMWRLQEHASRTNTGVIAVENGTLRFDSIAEAGTNCSFGLSTELYDDYVGAKDANRRIPHAFVLGGGTDASPTEGMLEYSGNGSAFCTTRLAGVKTAGGFKSGSLPLRFKGVTAAGSGNKTLVLDGSSTEENVIHTVTNGAGTLSVHKRGSGTWYLDGELSFSGTLSVDEGTLVVRSPAEKYSYYRFTIKEIGYTCSRYEEITTPSSMSDFERRSVCLSEFVLYDSEGVQQNVMSVSNRIWTQIAPGGFGFAKDSYSNALVKASSSNPLGAMFDHAGAYAYMQFPASPRLDDPSTWVPIVMRLDDGANEIERFDMYFTYTIGSAPYCGRNPTAISVEGSADGFVWDMLYENDAVVTPAASGASLWLSKNWGGTPTAAARKDQGIPIRGRRASMPVYDVLDNVSSVYVATGATLRAENGSPVISRLHVGAYGAGTIDGFSFAVNGELEGDDLASGEKGLAVSWGDCENIDNVAGWNVVSGGKRYARRVVVTQNRLRVLPKGTSITLR
jgi:autotransporter-associated beta strand protein